MTGDGGIVRLNTEVYGGPIMSTWFDRPLTLAGRVIVRSKDVMKPVTKFLHVRRPLLQISNLAIHFNRQVNDGVKLSKQKDMLPILGIIKDELEKGKLLTGLICEELKVKQKDILDFDLYLADATPACTFGIHNEFISSGRLDDLSMVHAGLQALLQSGKKTPKVTQVLAIFDNEETGSQTKQGAGSPFLASLIDRIVLAQGGTAEDFHRSIETSFWLKVAQQRTSIVASRRLSWCLPITLMPGTRITAKSTTRRIILCLEADLSSSSMRHRSMQVMPFQQPSLQVFARRQACHASVS